MKGRYSLAGLTLILLIALACNLPSNIPTPLPIPPTPTIPPPPAPGEPTYTPTPPVTHVLYPAENVRAGGGVNYDVDSSVTAPEHRAPYGDSYNLNRLERPFTQTVMDYQPDVDIVKFRLSEDPNWYYIFIEVQGASVSTGALSADYGVELDRNRDGHGDYLIWAKPPYSTAWKADGVSVHEDTNNDSGGLSAQKSDAPFNGNGYDKTIFDSGRGDDPDLAWVRVDPSSPTTIQIAFKKSLIGATFMWGAWADLNLRDPAQFSYNDRFTEAEAGSPEKNEAELYPIKQLFSVDNTCRLAVGFIPNGFEPMLCSIEQPTPEPRAHGPTPVNPTVTPTEIIIY